MSSPIKSIEYSPIRRSLRLEKVVVIHRHGDRTPLARELGPKYPEDKKMEQKWLSILPEEKTLSKLQSIGEILHQSSQEKESILYKDLYTGWDRETHPFGQLSERGTQQMISLGRRLRARYPEEFISADLEESSEHLSCRSTFLCRTIHSLRAVLFGFYEKNNCDENRNGVCSSSSSSSAITPLILTRPRTEETLYPQADGRCETIIRARQTIEPFPQPGQPPLPPQSRGREGLLPSYYQEMTEKMRRVFGFPATEAVPWLALQEVLLCYREHYQHFLLLPLSSSSSPAPSDANSLSQLFADGTVTSEDVVRVSEIIGTIWKILYSDPLIGRLGMGRFVSELLNDLKEGEGEEATSSSSTFSNSKKKKKKKLFFYSGHDSTLVPLLIILKQFDSKKTDKTMLILRESFNFISFLSLTHFHLVLVLVLVCFLFLVILFLAAVSLSLSL
jgi:hypothetical protein